MIQLCFNLETFIYQTNPYNNFLRCLEVEAWVIQIISESARQAMLNTVASFASVLIALMIEDALRKYLYLRKNSNKTKIRVLPISHE